jgi:hypothetical protein
LEESESPFLELKNKKYLVIMFLFLEISIKMELESEEEELNERIRQKEKIIKYLDEQIDDKLRTFAHLEEAQQSPDFIQDYKDTIDQLMLGTNADLRKQIKLLENQLEELKTSELRLTWKGGKKETEIDRENQIIRLTNRINKYETILQNRPKKKTRTEIRKYLEELKGHLNELQKERSLIFGDKHLVNRNQELHDQIMSLKREIRRFQEQIGEEKEEEKEQSYFDTFRKRDEKEELDVPLKKYHKTNCMICGSLATRWMEDDHDVRVCDSQLCELKIF